MTSTPLHIGDERKATKWQHRRLGLEVSIAAVVAVAILCVLITALSSAHRADEVALDTERHLLLHAFDSRSEWSLRKLDDVVPGDGSALAARDPVAWLQDRVRHLPETLLNVNYIGLVDRGGGLAKVMADDAADTTANVDLPELIPVRDFMRAAKALPRAWPCSARRLPNGGNRPPKPRRSC